MTKILLALPTLAITTGAASAQQRTDSCGKVVGRSSTDSQGTTTVDDAAGRTSAGSPRTLAKRQRLP